MAFKLITPPASEPVTLAEAKTQLRVDVADEDALISSLISAARETCEQRLQRSIMTQTWELVLDDFPMYDNIELQYPPVQSVTSVKYVSSTTGTEVTLASNQYALDNESEHNTHWITPASGVDFPETDDVANALRVRYVAGYTTVPASIKNWILLAVGYMYERCNSGETVHNIPHDFFSGLLDRYKVWSM